MQRSRESFFVIGSAAWNNKIRVRLTDLRITLKTVTIAKELQDAHTNYLATNPMHKALYPISKHICKQT